MATETFNLPPRSPPEEAEYQRQIMVRHLRVGCYLVIVLMPFGFLLDWFYYYDERWHFLIFRLACSLLLTVVPAVLRTALGQRFYQAVGVYVALLPAFFICCMIYDTEGAASPYYAGLNLILLAVAFVLRWSVGLSLLTLILISAMYVSACLMHGFPEQGLLRERAISEFANNMYFLGLTGVIVVTGSLFHQRLRVRENNLRLALARSKKELEERNQELQVTQRQLVESEKRRALGVLAGGIIHDIGNTLNHTRTNLFALRKRVSSIASDQTTFFERISSDVELGIKQAMSTIQRVRVYTHPNTTLCEQVEVKELVESGKLFTSSRWRDARIQVVEDLEPGQTIWGNKHSLIDVMVNLILNSADALKLRTFEDGEEPTIWITGKIREDKSVLSVRDNGSGIDPAIIDKIFDPYFTTKDIGEGTGLGLSTCKSTAEEYGGRIFVRSEPGSYCEVTLEFPAKGRD